MALANVAELLYQSGLRVLIVDWDLEAPGLERFFEVDQEEIANRPGIIDMLIDYKLKMSRDTIGAEINDLPFIYPEELAFPIYEDFGKGNLSLLTSGKRSRNNLGDYASSVMEFNWQEFYSKWEGEVYFEWLRKKFEGMADIVLIDSRTGVTEMGGVCAYQLADTVILFCAPNRQNLDGTNEMAIALSRQELIKARKDRPLNLIIVPARVEDRAERKLLIEFEKQFCDKFDNFIPQQLKGILKSYFSLKIPHVPFFSFYERVATRNSIGLEISDDIVKAYQSLVGVMTNLLPHESTAYAVLQVYAETTKSSKGLIKKKSHTSPEHQIDNELKIKLIVDIDWIYRSDFSVTNFVKELNELYQIEIFEFGHKTPISLTEFEHLKPDSLYRSFPALIAPLLSGQAKSTLFLLFTDKKILDLDDITDEWKDRLFLCCSTTNENLDWPNYVIVRKGIYTELINIIEKSSFNNEINRQ